MFATDELISIYTRAQAIEDGVLIDVSQMAREAGFRFPVAVTCSVWHRVVVPDEISKRVGQSEEGRLWDVLWLARLKAKLVGGSEFIFGVLVTSHDQTKSVQLKAVCGPGDQAEPVITIMLPGED